MNINKIFSGFDWLKIGNVVLSGLVLLESHSTLYALITYMIGLIGLSLFRTEETDPQNFKTVSARLIYGNPMPLVMLWFVLAKTGSFIFGGVLYIAVDLAQMALALIVDRLRLR